VGFGKNYVGLGEFIYVFKKFSNGD